MGSIELSTIPKLEYFWVYLHNTYNTRRLHPKTTFAYNPIKTFALIISRKFN